MANGGPVPRRARPDRRRAFPDSRTVSTSARSAAASGGATTPAARGSRSSTAQPIASIGAIAVAPSDPQRALRRLRRGRHALGHLVRQRHVQVGRRREDLGAHRALGHAADRADPRGSAAIRTSSSSRRSGHALRAEPGARRLPLEGRREDLDDASSSRTRTPARSTSPSIRATRKTILAALWQTRRPPWNVYPPSNGPGSGLYRSTDGGDTWKPVTDGLARPRSSAASASRSRRATPRPRLRPRGREGGRPLRLRRRRRHDGRARAETGGSGSAAGTSPA